MKEAALLSAVCDLIRQRREKLNLSQAHLAELTGLHRSYIGDLERGARNVAVKNLAKLAVALDIAPSKLLALAEKRINKG